jgi:uncharacterized protein YqiB (DUF1249 family)
VSIGSNYKIDLVRTMADCDANFIRLLKLMPDLESYRVKCLQGLEESGLDGLRLKASVDEMASFDLQNFPEFGREFALVSPSYKAVDMKIRLRVVEVFRYTSTLVIEQLNTLHSLLPALRISVRLYHDARTAEAVEYQGHKALLAKYALPNAKMYHQDEKRQINEFLGEWLSLCLAEGYSSKAPEFVCTA